MNKKSDLIRAVSQAIIALSILTLLSSLTLGVMVWTVMNPEGIKSVFFREQYEANDSPIDLDGLVDDVGREVVAQNCTRCHSAKLVIQNRATREGWKSMIVWMQDTQNLWPLGDNEPIILDYLSKNYGPQKKGRRQNLANIEWYELDQ